MARDYLAIQGSSVPSERAFSSGGLTGTSLRNRLSPAIFEALQILKSAYKNKHISAAQEAEGHIQAYLEALAVLEDDEGSLELSADT
jgi:hAT family C-terminal dimerisation region